MDHIRASWLGLAEERVLCGSGGGLAALAGAANLEENSRLLRFSGLFEGSSRREDRLLCDNGSRVRRTREETSRKGDGEKCDTPDLILSLSD